MNGREPSGLWDPAEALAPERLRELQSRRLREVLARLEAVPFYREAFAAGGVDPASVRSLDDVRRLPFTTKDDLRRHHPLGFLAVAAQGPGAHPRLLRHHRQAHLRRLYAGGPAHLVRTCAPASWWRGG